MAITPQAAGVFAAVDRAPNTTTLTIPNVVVAVGADRLLEVRIGWFGTAAPTITGITRDGQSLSAQLTVNPGDGIALWTLVAPNVGTADVVVTFSATVVGTDNSIYGTARCWDGVDQTTPVRDADGTVSAGATTHTTPALTTVAGDLVVGLSKSWVNASMTVTAAETLDAKDDLAGTEDHYAASHTFAVGVTTTLAWSFGGASPAGQFGAIALIPAAASGPVLPFRTMLGMMRVR